MARFVKGKTGNPGGRPKIPKCVVEAAKAHTVDAIKALAEIATSGSDDSARVKAAEALLNRAWGKPVETHALTGANGEPLLPKQDLSKLSENELLTMHALASKITAS